MKCDSVERGCEWEGTRGTCGQMQNSLSQQVQRQMILRKDLEKHLIEWCVNRDYKCQYCGEKDTFANITGIHDDTCKKKSLPCPNSDCSESMQRAEIKQHLEIDYEHTVISCKYEGIGCDVKMKRNDMGAHEQDDKAHLHQALNTVVRLQDDLQSATETIESMKKENEAVQDKLKSVQDRLQSVVAITSRTVEIELLNQLEGEAGR